MRTTGMVTVPPAMTTPRKAATMNPLTGISMGMATATRLPTKRGKMTTIMITTSKRRRRPTGTRMNMSMSMNKRNQVITIPAIMTTTITLRRQRMRLSLARSMPITGGILRRSPG